MGLFKTLKIVRNNVAHVGGVQVQSVNNQATSVHDESDVATSYDSSGTRSPADVGIAKLTGISATTDGMQRINNPSVASLSREISSNQRFTMPGFSSEYNSISPSYLKHLNLENFRDQSSNEANISTREFQPYERLTGISHERPEVLMMTQFLPFFIKENSHNVHSYVDRLRSSGIHSFMTDAGWYADTQINSRNIRAIGVLKTLRRVKRRNFFMRSTFRQRRQALGTHLDSLNTATNFLLGLVRKTDALKNKLDLRDDIHVTKPQRMIKNHSLKFTKIRSNWLNNSLQNVATKFLPASYDVPDSLVRLGYMRRNAEQIFSSTKIWMQMLLEYKSVLLDHSLEFLDIEPSAQKKDDNAINLTRADVELFNVKKRDSPGLLSLENLSGLTSDAVRATVRNTSRGFSFIYEQGATFRSEEARIAALANLLSKEFNYSKGLATTWVTRALTDFFAYVPADFGNVSLFDNVLGQFGSNVSEIPRNQTNSLASIGQKQPTDNVAVLPFESKYLEGDNGIITPGSTWYVDQVFKTPGQNFDTARLEQFSSELKKAHANFSTIVNGLNIFQASSTDRNDRKRSSFEGVLSDPVRLVETQISSFIDDAGRTRPQIKNDRLTSIYSMAQTSDDIKAILFLYTMNRITRSYNPTTFNFQGTIVQDNTPISDSLITRLVALLAPATRRSSAVTRQVNDPRSSSDANDLDVNTIKTAMKRGTHLTQVIETFMSKVLSTLGNTNALNNDRTRFSGHLDTVLMMVAFDLIIAMISRYGNQRIVGRQQNSRRSTTTNTGRSNYIVSSAAVNFRTARTDLINRLEREQALIHMITWSITNTLKSLYGSIDEYTNYLKSPPALASLRAISNVVNNTKEFQSLLSEQQVMMLGSTVHDLIGKFSRKNTRSPYNLDLDGDGDFDSDDEIKILDDSLVSPKVKNALYGFFGSAEFTESKAFNKRILTVGIPLGFVSKLQQKVTKSKLKRTSFKPKQNDIVNVVVYKIDMLNQDLIYKPQRFMFELSRFPVRNDLYFKNIPDNPSIDDLADAIPTRDFEESFEEGGNSIAYWRSSGDGDRNSRLALDADTYDFLSQEEKAEIIKNHLTSYILEIYIKLMTGLNVAEHTFDIDPGDIQRPVEIEFIKQLTEQKVQQVANFVSFKRINRSALTKSSSGKLLLARQNTRPVGGTLFRPTCRRRLSFVDARHRHNLLTQPRLTNLSGLSGKVALTHQIKSSRAPKNNRRMRALQESTSSMALNLGKLSARHVPKLLNNLRSVAYFSRMQTTLSSGLNVSKQLLRPKQFDRVFNVIVDPDEFEIDYDKTMESEHGKIAFEMLMKQGDLIPASITPTERRFRRNLPLKSSFRQFGRQVNDPGVNNFRFRDRDKNQGDLMFEKYFITIETYDEEGI